MPGLGRKTWSPGDTLTASDVNGYLMDQSVMVFAGTAARASAIPSPSAGMVAYSTATSLQVYNGSAWVSLSTGYGVASGGTTITPWSVSTINYNGSKFTTDGTLTVSTAGLFDVVIQSGGVGGNGGGNGNSAANMGGGGSAGQQVRTTVYLAAGTYAVKIGAGQAGQASHIKTPQTSANASHIASVAYSFGGGMGDGYVGGGTGGSWLSSAFVLLAGGTASGTGNSAASGGGSGVTGAGGNASGTTGGAGGTGFDATEYNSNTTFGIGGGGAGGSATGAAGAATSGGGTGGVNANGGNGTANTGGGGGGCASASPYNLRTGGNGGSGIVFVRWRV